MSGYAQVRSESFSEVDARIGELCFAPINGLRQSGVSSPKSATFGHVASNLHGDLHRSVVGFERA
jgi:hypothetical protein